MQESKEWWFSEDTIMNESGHIAYMNAYCKHTHAQRIIACVNGCRGIKNPEAVGEVVEALKLVDGIAGTLMDELVGNKAADWGIVNGGLVKVNKALKHIQGIKP